MASDKLPALLQKWLGNPQWWGNYRKAWTEAVDRECPEGPAEDALFAGFGPGSLTARADAALVLWLRVRTGEVKKPKKRGRNSLWEQVEGLQPLERSMVAARLIMHCLPLAMEVAGDNACPDYENEEWNEKAVELWEPREEHLRNASGESWEWETVEEFMEMREDHEEPVEPEGR